MKLQKELINDCNKSLVEIARPNNVTTEYLSPVFTEDGLLRMQQETTNKANEEKARGYWGWDWMPGWCAELLDNVVDFLAGEKMGYSEKKHITIMNGEILTTIKKAMNVIIGLLQSDVTNLLEVYRDELSKNAKLKTDEYDELCVKLQKAEDMQKEKESVKADLIAIGDKEKNIKEIKGGIDVIS